MSPGVHPGLTSIIVPCWNQREFTRLCLPALFRHTRPAWELIVIDNGSTDGTGLYLAGVRDAASVPVTVISNAENRGYPAAINQGLEVARGEFLVLLNNDAVVTDGWLDQLIALTRVSTAETKRSTAEIAEPRTEPLAGEDQEGRTEGGPGILKILDYAAEAAQASPPSAPLSPPSQGGEGSQSELRPVGLRIGLVGPMSNYATPPQWVEHVPYRDLDEMQAFARRWRAEHRGKWFTVAKLSGFCLLVTRAVFETIGSLDERFGLGFYDDDDLAMRARRAGFELAVAHDLFIHHFGSRTFLGNGVDAEALLEENARRFAAKWGPARPRGRPVELRAWTPQQPPQGEGPGFGEEDRPQIDADENSQLRIPSSRISRENGPLGSPSAPPASASALSAPNLRECAQSADTHRRRSADRPGPRARISLTLIARDEQDHLPQCLESVRGIFDEIIVVDTGSADRTKTIAEEFGARVFDFPWIDDFAAARNAALAHATGDYIFWLDADDVVDPPERAKLRALLGALDLDQPAAYVVRCACDPGADGSGGQTVVDHIRLFPLRDDVRWTYRVHEQILPALQRAQIPVRWTDLVVRHTGYTDPALRARKLDRDTRILLAELKERPDEPFVLFNLGAIAIERQEWSAALGYLTRSLSRSAPSDSITRKLFALIARAHQMLGDTGAALRACAEGLSFHPEDAELWFRQAVVHRHRGESSRAESCWRRILSLHRPEQYCSLDEGIYGHLTRRNLAMLAAERGDRAAAAQLWREVLAECPGDAEASAHLERLAPCEGTERTGTP
jgi:glycosyltransferase involved in cell wall biosynthesis